MCMESSNHIEYYSINLTKVNIKHTFINIKGRKLNNIILLSRHLIHTHICLLRWLLGSIDIEQTIFDFLEGISNPLYIRLNIFISLRSRE